MGSLIVNHFYIKSYCWSKKTKEQKELSTGRNEHACLLVVSISNNNNSMCFDVISSPPQNP